MFYAVFTHLFTPVSLGTSIEEHSMPYAGPICISKTRSGGQESLSTWTEVLLQDRQGLLDSVFR
jgi:hypothetical protein